MITLNVLKNFLLKPVVFILNDKTVRKGKLILFHQSDYYVKFTLQTNKNITKIYEIPYPYKILARNEQVTFSYMISDLCRDNYNKTEYIFDNTPKEGINKVHDKQLTISVIEDD